MTHGDDHAHTDGRMQDKSGFGDPVIGTAIGTRLRSLFAEFTGDDTPAPLLDLIDRLERRERAAPESTG